MKTNKSNHYAQLFTIIEVIAVLIVLSVLTAIVVSRIGYSNAELNKETQLLKSYLRYAQSLSMSDDSETWGIRLEAKAIILQNNGVDATIPLPLEESARHQLTNVTLNATTITFDKWGSPGSSTISITLDDGTETSTVTISANSGFVP